MSDSTSPLSIPFSAIIEGERIRQKENYGDVTSLADSMKRVGSINPIGLSRRAPLTPAEEKVAHEGFVYEIVHGGRRYHALKTKVRPDFLHHGAILDKDRLGFLFADEVEAHHLREAELDENLHRKDMEWQEVVLAVDRIHMEKKKKNIRWTVVQTAKILPKSWEKSSVANFLLLAKRLRAGDEEVKACESMTEALKLLLKRKEDEALAELRKRTLPAAGRPSSTASFLDELKIETKKGGDVPSNPMLVDSAAILTDTQKPVSTTKNNQASPSVSNAEVKSDPSPSATIPLSSMFMLGDSMDILARLPESSFDHIVTDIPYGIDMDNLEEGFSNIDSVKDTHDVEQNVSMMPTFLAESFRLVRPGGFCVLCYDLDHHEKLLMFAEASGWRPQRWPYIACKSSPCRNNAAQKNTTKNYECVMFLRRDETSALRQPVSTSWKSYDFRTERKMYNNPFAKPFELWRDIYSAIAFTGQKVLDPFCGEMSASRAAVMCGLVPFGIEISETHYNKGLEHVKAAYLLLHKNNVTFE